MAILNNSNAISSGGYDINNSLRFRSSASAYLNRTPATTTNQTTFTFSFWLKRGSLGVEQFLYVGRTGSNFPAFAIRFNSNDTLQIDQYTTGGTLQFQLTTTQVFRDPSAWYHIVIAFDTTQATASNRIKFYSNGSQITSFSTATYPSSSLAVNVNTTNVQYINTSPTNGSYSDCYMAEYNFIDGQALTPSSFGETDTTTGSWKPKAYTGTYGTNGFYLKFSDIATTSGSNAGLGKDFSGNTNYWTTNNISVTAGTTYDAMIDSPTLTSATVANYAVMNPLAYSSAAATGLITNGNLTVSNNNGANNAQGLNTIGVTSGKWYWEVTPTAMPTSNGSVMFLGITEMPYSDASARMYRSSDGYYFNGTAWAAYGATFTANDIIGIALDCDNQTIEFFKNNTSQGQKTSIGISSYVEFALYQGSSTPGSASFNFGQRPFSYTPPTGFVRLNTYNLPDSTIKKGNTVMDATLYTGNGTSQTITTAASFKPDLVWIKGRSFVDGHTLFDTVRGATISLSSNTTTADVTRGTALTAFTSTGFTVGSDTLVNFNANTLVAWQWQAGQGSTSSNTSGARTSTVSVNSTAGFSVVTWTGSGSGSTTIGHGLGVAPAMIIIKDRVNAYAWNVYHKSLGNTSGINLNSTGASSANVGWWNNTSPTSSLFTVGTYENDASNYVAYCFAEIAGFSKFGSYTGNGSTDGPFIYLGFRPKFVMFKCSSSTESGNADWHMQDSSRNVSNISTGSNRLFANSSSSEAANAEYVMDFVSNGFKLRTNAANYGQNTNGNTYIYMAFAENPFKNANAR
jgi:hypothetical protein